MYLLSILTDDSPIRYRRTVNAFQKNRKQALQQSPVPECQLPVKLSSQHRGVSQEIVFDSFHAWMLTWPVAFLNRFYQPRKTRRATPTTILALTGWYAWVNPPSSQCLRLSDKNITWNVRLFSPPAFLWLQFCSIPPHTFSKSLH